MGWGGVGTPSHQLVKDPSNVYVSMIKLNKVCMAIEYLFAWIKESKGRSATHMSRVHHPPKQCSKIPLAREHLLKSRGALLSYQLLYREPKNSRQLHKVKTHLCLV